ncbi:MAG TPA: trypsin-like serine protease [Acidimicrobiales bacterium]|nr:trypsin-like serine protease [Acidimicrobiales bacterium]
MAAVDERFPLLVKAASDFSRTVSGDDDQLFVETFHVALEVAEQLHGGGEGRHQAALEALRRVSKPFLTRSGPDPAQTIYSDPVFIANALRLIPLAMTPQVTDGAATLLPTPEAPEILRGSDPRTFLGDDDDPRGAFLDCVAVGSADEWAGSGTLIAKNLVLTAGHCPTARVLFGSSIDQPLSVVSVDHAVTPPDFVWDPPSAPRPDLAVLVLAEDADVTPRPLAPAGALARHSEVTVAGFGADDQRAIVQRGIKQMATIPCGGDVSRYGGDPAFEFVAADPVLSRDSCRMDSGGPVYVRDDGRWSLAGVTSRKIPVRVRECGDGSIYTNVSPYERWIRSIPGIHW